MLQPPRLLVYNDGRHAHTYGYEPPVGLRQIREPVDELIDSGADTLLYCVGDTRVLLYDTAVGEHWGHNTSDWNTAVWYRPKVSLERAIAQGIDPLDVICKRANEKGIRILPTLLLNTSSWEDRDKTFHGRCSDFCFDHPDYCIDFDGGDYGFDYNLPQVRDQQMAVIRELLERYSSDGIELSFHDTKPFCKKDEVDQLRDTLTAWLEEIRAVARSAASAQNRDKDVVVRVPATWQGCQTIGLNVPAWLEEGLVDWVIAYPVDPVGQHDQDVPLESFVQHARRHDHKVFAAVPSLIQNDWYMGATREMFHAAAANAHAQGVDGIMLPGLYPKTYPWTENEYAIMRHMGHADMLERKDKRFRVRTQTARDARARDMAPLGNTRPLPVTLTESRPGTDIPIRVGDDIATALAEGCLEGVTLATRITQICPEDELRFFFNDRELPGASAKVSDYTFKIGFARPEATIGPHYWFDFPLPEEGLPRRGHNVFRVDLVKRAPALSRFLPVTVHDVEINVRYRPHRNAPRQFHRYSDAR